MPPTSPTPTAKTVGWILDASTQFLERHQIESARLVVELLAARLLKCKRLELQLKHALPMPPALINAMRRGISRVSTGEPVQYVLGQWDFRNITLKVDRRALIPRPETESLVALLLHTPSLQALSQPRIIDYGTGSGCIALSLAKEWPQAKIIALDTSEDALALARENAALLGLTHQISWINPNQIDLADILEPSSIDAIISNPPYIPTEDCNHLDPSVRAFEPMSALDGGADGMVITRHIIEEAAMLLTSGGHLFLEISAENNQAPVLTDFLCDVGFESITTHLDVHQHARFLAASLAAGL